MTVLVAFGCATTGRAQGVLTNGGRQDGSIAAAGQSDAWTTTANTGDRMTFQAAKLSGGAGFTPRIEVFSPDGASLGSSAGSLAARLDIQAAAAGTYTVMVSDAAGTGTGNYRMQLAQVPEPFVVPAGDEGGPLTNGTNNDGTIDLGDLDLWTFAAAPGDHVTLQIAELSGSAAFTPMIEVMAPDGRRLGVNSSAVAARLDLQAAVAGTYTVLVSDANQTGTGTYRLRLAQVPEAFVVAPGDQGGALTNGANQLGTIDVGDLDQWSFTADAGDRIALQLAKLSGGAAFTPQLELFAPDGRRLAFDSDLFTARVDIQARDSGTYRVLVSALSPDGTGDYQLQLAQVPGPFTVPAGDEGGPLADGVDQDGTITMGDLDLWTFAASPGDHITVVGTELTGGANFEPKLELFGPKGDEKQAAQDPSTATLDVAIQDGGTYTVLVRDANKSGAGTYQLHLTRGSIEPAGTNVLVNGTTYVGSISPVGHEDLWTFTASAGETIIVRAGETASSSLTPMLQLYGPNGALLSSAYSGAAAEVVTRATNSGTFSVLVRDNSNGQLGTGNYRLSLAKTGSPLVISPNDEGGPMVNGTTYVGTIDTGDIDAWTISADAGETLIVRMGQSGSGT